MNHSTLLEKMTPPGAIKPGKYRNGVIQIHVTRACDKACYNCTQGSNFGGKYYFMTPELFERAVDSLKDWWGVVGVFGGNPAISPHFEEYCRILRRDIPYEQRGLWCNHPRGKGKIMAETFDPTVSNLNVHCDAAAYAEFKRTWPNSRPFGLTTDSLHSPTWVAMKDMMELPINPKVGNTTENTEENRNKLISDCDINKHWSAMIGMFRGELRAWFCEIAGAQSILHQEDEHYPDTGITPYRSWWSLPMTSFSYQVKKHCHECGVPMRGVGTLATTTDENAYEHVSGTHVFMAKTKRLGRKVALVVVPSSMNGTLTTRMTDYVQNGIAHSAKHKT